jgi:hypothetical protein
MQGMFFCLSYQPVNTPSEPYAAGSASAFAKNILDRANDQKRQMDNEIHHDADGNQ